MKWPRRSTPSSVRPTSTAGNGSVTMMRRTVGSPVRAAAMRLPTHGGAQAGFDVDEIGQLGHRVTVWHSAARKFKLGACRCRC